MTTIKHQITIIASPDKVYAALATQTGLRHWWTADTRADANVGGKAEFGFDKRSMVFRMKIEELVPGKRVVPWARAGGRRPRLDGPRTRCYFPRPPEEPTPDA